MTLAEIKLWRKQAQRLVKSEYGGADMAQRIVALCDEVERLNALVDENEQRLGDYSLMPFGKRYKGVVMHKVPDDYLAWWLRKNGDRNILSLEARHGVGAKKWVAVQSVKLYDYLVERFNRGTG